MQTIPINVTLKADPEKADIDVFGCAELKILAIYLNKTVRKTFRSPSGESEYTEEFHYYNAICLADGELTELGWDEIQEQIAYCIYLPVEEAIATVEEAIATT